MNQGSGATHLNPYQSHPEPEPDPFSEVWIRIRILPFSNKGVEQTEIMLVE